MRELTPADHAVRDARRIADGNDALSAETWASSCLGQAWVQAPLSERDAEHKLIMGVIGRVSNRPSPHGTAAVAALRRVAEPRERVMLDETLEILAETQPVPPWMDAPDWVPVAAYRSLDVWEARRVLFVDFDGPRPHTLLTAVSEVGGRLVVELALVEPGSAAKWGERGGGGELPPMQPLVELPVDEVLADLADAMRQTDITLPRQADEDYVALRALAWARCRAHLRPFPDVEPLADTQRRELVDAFVGSGGLPDDDLARSLAELFLDYGDGYLPVRPLGWDPDSVALFLVDWLPRKATLDAAQRAALPDTLRHWVRFALAQRGVAPEWIDPVVTAVDEHRADFDEAFDDESSWGPAKRIVAELTARGVDLSDKVAVEQAIAALNAENMVQRLLPE